MRMSWSPWKKSRAVASGVASGLTVVAASASGTDGVKPAGESGVEEADPIFEGGGQVLLHPSYWERAGWGIAVLAALAATSPASAGEAGGSAGGFPRTSQSRAISLHECGR